MTDSAIEVGLIGYGLAGRAFHAPVIRAVPGMRLTAILQRTGNEAAEKYPDIRVVRSLEELLAIREILNRLSARIPSTETPVVAIVSSGARHFLRQITETNLPNLFFVAHNEVPPGTRVQSLGTIT